MTADCRIDGHPCEPTCPGPGAACPMSPRTLVRVTTTYDDPRGPREPRVRESSTHRDGRRMLARIKAGVRVVEGPGVTVTTTTTVEVLPIDQPDLFDLEAS